MQSAPRPARLPHQASVELLDPRSAVPFARAMTVNVSMRGACLSFAGEITRGQRIGIRLRGPAGTTRAEGKVVWVAEPSVPGGVRLVGLDLHHADGGWLAIVHAEFERSRRAETPQQHAQQEQRAAVVERVVEEASEVELTLVSIDEDGPRPRARRSREKLDVLLKLPDGSALPATTIDVSSSGLGLFVSDPQPHGSKFSMEIVLPDGRSLRLQGTSVRIRRTPLRDAQVHFMGVALAGPPPEWDRYVGALQVNVASANGAANA